MGRGSLNSNYAGAYFAPFNFRENSMASSVWSGYLTFGLISMPVRLFSGARSSGISFNMLHRDDLSRVKQQYVCPAEDNKVVERSEIVKGFEYRKGEYIVIEPEEIKKIEPRTAKTMEILEFVKTTDVDPGLLRIFVLHDAGGSRPPSVRAADKSSGRQRICGHCQAHHAQPRVHSVSASARRRHDAAHHVLRGRSPRRWKDLVRRMSRSKIQN